MIDIRAPDSSTPRALIRAVVDHARRTGASLSWVEEILADPQKRLAFLGRDQPDHCPAWLATPSRTPRGTIGQSAAHNA